MVSEDVLYSTLSGEEAEIRLHEIGMPNTISEKFNSSDWKEKKDGFGELNKWISSNMETVKPYFEHVLRFLKLKMKDWKESNLNVMKEAFPFLLQLLKNNEFSFSKRCFSIIAPFAVNNMSDAKYVAPAAELITTACEVVNPKSCITLCLDILKD